MIRNIKIGTRSSPLAIAQTKLIADQIRNNYPQINIELVKIKTSGDKNMSPFSSNPSGIKGLFTLELEQALINHEIDFAVHSLKDLPAKMNPDLPIIAYSKREDPRDALIINENSNNNIIGSSSLRRRLQIERIYPQKNIIPIRGNINTRIKKLDDGEYNALVLAAAGLIRLNLDSRIKHFFSIDEIMPAPCQGILACQGRIDGNYDYLECVNDESSRDCAIAERSFASELGAGCNVPVGCYAEILNDNLRLRGLFIDEKNKNFHKGKILGLRSEADYLGRKLAEVINS